MSKTAECQYLLEYNLALTPGVLSLYVDNLALSEPPNRTNEPTERWGAGIAQS